MTAEFSNLAKLIETIVRDKGIERHLVVDAVTQGVLSAARKKYGTYREIEANYNEESGEVDLYEFKEVVKPEDFIDDEVEIKWDEAQRDLDPDCKIGDYIGIKLDSSDLDRVAVQTAKQIIMQKVREAEHNIIFKEFEARRGEIASGIVRRIERRTIVVDLGRTEAYLPQAEQIPGENYKPGDRLQGFILDVKQSYKGPQIIMSRSSENYMVKLFEIEIPEIHDGVVKIVAAAREPGSRAKIAVTSKDSMVDPVGACVGMKGSRVQNVVQELQGEKIDIVSFEEDIIRFVCNAIQPSEVSRVFVNEDNKEMEVVVPDSHLSLAIGKKGQNVRLATKLTGWHITIVSESNVATRQTNAIFNLCLLQGISKTMAQNIYQSGFHSFQALANATVEGIKVIPGYEDKNKAQKLIDDSKALVQKYKDEGKEIPTAPPSNVAMPTTTQKQVKKQEPDLSTDLSLPPKDTSIVDSALTAYPKGSIIKEKKDDTSKNLETKANSHGTAKKTETNIQQEALKQPSQAPLTSNAEHPISSKEGGQTSGKTASQIQAEQRLKAELSALKKTTSVQKKALPKTGQTQTKMAKADDIPMKKKLVNKEKEQGLTDQKEPAPSQKNNEIKPSRQEQENKS